MREPWDLSAAYIANLQQQAGQARQSADNFLMRMFDQVVNRGNNAIGHGYNQDILRQRNDYATEADTVAFGRQLQRDENAFDNQLTRDTMQRGYQKEDLEQGQKWRQENMTLEQKLYAEREAAKGEYPGYTRRYVPGVQQSLAGTESGGNFGARNNAVGAGGARGHFGRLQFGIARLNEAKAAGVIPADMTPEQFMADPRAQRRTEAWHLNDIDNDMRARGLDKFIGQTVGGVQITPEAITAMAHLGGIGGAEKFLRTGGQYNPSDVNGTSLSDYARTHGGSGASISEEGARRYSGADTQSPITTEILGLPVASTMGSQSNIQVPSWQQQFLAAQGLQPVEIVTMSQAALDMMPEDMKANFVPFVDGIRGSNEKAMYIRVEPIARDRNSAQGALPKPSEIPPDAGTVQIDGVDIILPD